MFNGGEKLQEIISCWDSFEIAHKEDCDDSSAIIEGMWTTSEHDFSCREDDGICGQ